MYRFGTNFSGAIPFFENKMIFSRIKTFQYSKDFIPTIFEPNYANKTLYFKLIRGIQSWESPKKELLEVIFLLITKDTLINT